MKSHKDFARLAVTIRQSVEGPIGEMNSVKCWSEWMSNKWTFYPIILSIGENLVSEQKDEVAEFQRKGSAFQQVCPRSRPSGGPPLALRSGLPFSVPFPLGRLPTALESQVEGEFARTSRKTNPGEFGGTAPRSQFTARCLIFVFWRRSWRQGRIYRGRLNEWKRSSMLI